ncbi:UNVERIFIED_CONTAM: Chalcone 4'-O-glucosyltransferase [Sesamum calycinum]|uniref:Chalcone 4'-O-glucosyltransferase n=1 Tax=Sesamum calycinum TaxID=2727403 RepID=A0AAW2RQ99_9LAMI
MVSRACTLLLDINCDDSCFLRTPQFHATSCYLHQPTPPFHLHRNPQHRRLPSPSISISASTTVTYHRSPPPSSANFNLQSVELFFEISRLTNPILRQALQEIQQKSNIKAFVIDFFSNPAFEVSTCMNIPTYYWFAPGAFGLCLLLHLPTIHETIAGDIGDLNDFLEVPGCPLLHSSEFPEGVLYRQENL